MERKKKKPEDSYTVMTQLVMPNDTNPLNNLMGGNLMRWMDVAGGICAGKHCEAHVVTASVDHVSFKLPIKVGQVVSLEATVTRAFKTSVELFVQVFVQDIKGLQPKEESNSAFFTFVALNDQNGKPKMIPEVEPHTEDQMQKYESAVRRREVRLILSGRMQAKDAKYLKEYFASV